MTTGEDMKSRFEEHRQSIFHATSTERALERISSRDLPLGTVIDVGASDGSWTAVALKFWTDAHCLLLDGNPVWREKLEAFAAKRKDVHILTAAAGAAQGSIKFHATAGDPFSGAVAPTADDAFETPMVRIDEAVRERNLPGPYLIKLDTHGFEREILEGCSGILQDTALLVIEMYLFQDEHRRFPAMCLHLENLGFRCADMSELLYRSHDFSLWQFDGFFLRADRKEFLHPVYF